MTYLSKKYHIHLRQIKTILRLLKSEGIDEQQRYFPKKVPSLKEEEITAEGRRRGGTKHLVYLSMCMLGTCCKCPSCTSPVWSRDWTGRVEGKFLGKFLKNAGSRGNGHETYA